MASKVCIYYVCKAREPYILVRPVNLGVHPGSLVINGCNMNHVGILFCPRHYNELYILHPAGKPMCASIVCKWNCRLF